MLRRQRNLRVRKGAKGRPQPTIPGDTSESRICVYWSPGSVESSALDQLTADIEEYLREPEKYFSFTPLAKRVQAFLLRGIRVEVK